MERFYDVAVMGAGPSGLAAAITVKMMSPDLSVVILEKKEKPAKKLRASGNGRGNLSNEKCDDLESVLWFFSQVGIAVRMDDEGRIYPYSEEAEAVAQTLVDRAAGLGVKILLNSRVKDAKADLKGGFRIFISEKDGYESCLKCRSFLIASGGKSFAAYGSSGDGYSLARSFGHQVTPLIPGLTAIEVKEDISSLKGVRAKGEVRLFDNGDLKFREKGEIQFREDSISGICVMNLSSALPAASSADMKKEAFAYLRISINLAPDWDAAGLVDFLRLKQQFKGAAAADMLETIVKKPLAHMLLAKNGLDEKKHASGLSAAYIVNLANGIRNFSFTPIGLKGWKEAQVTKGGVALDSVCSSTMESLLVKDLYFAGEVLDYDGPCGGFNLHNAWLTGIKAGRAIAQKLQPKSVAEEGI